MHIPPVHNRCALDFVIGGISIKCLASQADSKASGYAPVADADCDRPLYTMRGQSNWAPGPQTALIKGQP
jgi:hypothetical protein